MVEQHTFAEIEQHIERITLLGEHLANLQGDEPAPYMLTMKKLIEEIPFLLDVVAQFGTALAELGTILQQRADAISTTADASQPDVVQLAYDIIAAHEQLLDDSPHD